MTKIVVGATADAVLAMTNNPEVHGLSYSQRAGAFHLSIVTTTVDGNVQIKAGNANATVGLTDSQVTNALFVKSGQGGLDILTSGFHASTSGRGNVTIQAAATAIVALDGSTFGANVSIRGGNTVDLTTGGTTFAGNLAFKGSGVVDIFRLTDTTVDGKTSVSTGSGDDDVQFNGVELMGALSINTGNDDDYVYLDSYDNEPLGAPSFFDGPVKIVLGSGDDYLTAGVGDAGDEAIFGSSVLANGGSGNDTLDYLTGDQTFAVEPKIVGFETTI